jgi:hypothetical protein
VCLSLSLSLVVVDDFNVSFDTVIPTENDPPLIIDADAPESLHVSFQCFETVRWRGPDVAQVSGLIEHAQLSPRTMLDISRQLLRPGSFEYFPGFRVTERLNHPLETT